jgi:hypothetical protein
MMADVFLQIVAHTGATYTAAWKVANLLDAGLTVSAVAGAVSGVGSWVSILSLGIKHLIKSQGKRAAVFW